MFCVKDCTFDKLLELGVNEHIYGFRAKRHGPSASEPKFWFHGALRDFLFIFVFLNCVREFTIKPKCGTDLHFLSDYTKYILKINTFVLLSYPEGEEDIYNVGCKIFMVHRYCLKVTNIFFFWSQSLISWTGASICPSIVYGEILLFIGCLK